MTTSNQPKSVAQLEQDLADARELERQQSLAAQAANLEKARHAKLKADLVSELENRLLQISNTEVWLADRRADAAALADRIKSEFAEAQSSG